MLRDYLKREEETTRKNAKFPRSASERAETRGTENERSLTTFPTGVFYACCVSVVR